MRSLQQDDPAASRGRLFPPSQPIEDIYPLTRMQQGLLFRCVSHPDSPVFMGQWWALLEGPLKPDLLIDAWQAVVDRHPVLRTGFNWELKDKPFQVVHRQARLSVSRPDWSNGDWSNENDWRDRLSAFLSEDRAQPFALKRPPLLRIHLVRLAETRHLLVWSRHHLTVDGWSLGALLEEVFAIYAARLGGSEAQLPAPIAYRRYVEWERSSLSEGALAYWRTALAGFNADPGDSVSINPKEIPAICEVVRHLDAPEKEHLAVFAREHGLTVNTLVQGAWGLALARRSGCNDLLAGSVETVRPSHLQGSGGTVIGMQIAVLPVRYRLDDRPLREWLLALQAAMVEGREAGAIGFDRLREIIGVRHDALPFESLVGFQNYPLDESRALGKAGLTLVQSGDITLPDMPLNLMVEAQDGGLALRLMADGRRYGKSELLLLLDMLADTLIAMPAQADRPVTSIDCLPPVQAAELLAGCCAGASLTAAAECVPEAIVAQARAAPEAIAVRHGERSMTYGELISLAAAVAERLAAAGVAPGARVGLMLERTPVAVAAILGILLRGASYVPLDGAGPSERRDTMIAAAGIVAVMTGAEQLPELREGLGLTVDDLVARPAAHYGSPELSRETEAYVIFTSGSTGAPKGVSVSHDNLRWHVAARAAAYPDHPIGSFLLTFPLIFDGSITVLFSTLASGGTLVLPRAHEAGDADRLAALIAARSVTHTAMTPSLWGQVLQAATADQLASLRFTLVAGEACPRALVQRHAALLPGVALFNEYGPTEATVWSTFDRCRPEEREAVVPIGRPVPGTFAYVVDRQGRLCPKGTRGELLVAGPMVTNGYVGRPDLTAERFIVNPFCDDPAAATAYRTGDLASFGEDGRLRFHGRVDRQIKFNGYRIELEEIEACLGSHPAVAECALLFRGPGDGQPARLIAHVGGPDLPFTETLRHYLEQRLPSWMIPQALVLHEALPHTPSGKVDASALQDPPALSSGEPPQTERERAVAAVWKEALGLEAVGRLDNFFEIGGSSLLAMQVLSRLRREGAAFLELADLFETPRLADFALRLEEGAPADAQSSAMTPGRTFSSSEPAIRRRSRDRVILPGTAEEATAEGADGGGER